MITLAVNSGLGASESGVHVTGLGLGLRSERFGISDSNPTSFPPSLPPSQQIFLAKLQMSGQCEFVAARCEFGVRLRELGFVSQSAYRL